MKGYTTIQIHTYEPHDRPAAPLHIKSLAYIHNILDSVSKS
jgi:hypothetical protein